MACPRLASLNPGKSLHLVGSQCSPHRLSPRQSIFLWWAFLSLVPSHQTLAPDHHEKSQQPIQSHPSALQDRKRHTLSPSLKRGRPSHHPFSAFSSISLVREVSYKRATLM